jgi:hypothetical protein
MFGLAVGLPLLAVAILWSIVLRRQDRRRDRQLCAAASADLDATGLSWSGDPLGAPTLSGRVHGVDVVLENGSGHARPGVREHSELSCLVRVHARLEDQIVCRASEVDAVMGPLPSATRRKTGHESFDAAYATFGGETPWARPALLDGMRDLAMLWLRTRDGQCELAFPTLGATDLPRAATVAANVARASWGQPAVDMRRGPIEPFRSQWRWGGSGVGVQIVWTLGGFIGGLCGFIFGDMLLLDLDSPYECEPGARLERDGNGDGSWSGVSCSHGRDSFHGVHHLGGVVLGVAVAVLIGFAIVTMKRFQRSD